jgi:ELWxxDGT repeat protein
MSRNAARQRGAIWLRRWLALSLVIALLLTALPASAAGGPTIFLKDIAPGTESSLTGYYAVIGNVLYFGADDTTHGSELWRSDGTPEGTYMLRDIAPPSHALSGPSDLTVMGNKVFFGVYHQRYGAELWKSDGTREGTRLVKDIVPGPDGTWIGNLTVVGNLLYFSADDGVTGKELWRTDGTAAGTRRVKNINPGAAGSSPDNMVDVNGTLYFTADDGVVGRGLWKSDGTREGTRKVKNIRPGPYGAFISNMTNVGGTLYFSANDDVAGWELWKSDGTRAGTVMVEDIYPGSESGVSNISGSSKPWLPDGSILYFNATDGVHGAELWRSDGTVEGTYMVKDIFPNVNQNGIGPAPHSLLLWNEILYFAAHDGYSASDGGHGFELWRSDGTAEGTFMIKDIHPATNEYHVFSLTATPEAFYFSAEDGVHGPELWRSDGTAEGTVLVEDIRTGAEGSSPSHFTHAGSNLFFYADDGQTGKELWNLPLQ